MLTELRRYAVLPGHMPEMHARMSGMLLPLFHEHGIPKPIAIWENVETTSILSWMVEWPSFEVRQEAWTRFAPVFAAARQAQGTPELVTRTTLTVIAPWAGSSFATPTVAGCETAWHVQPRIGQSVAFVKACTDEAFDRIRSVAAKVEASSLLFGPLPQAFILLRWPDAQARAAGMAKLAREAMPPALRDSLTGDGERFGDRGEWEALDRAPYLK